MRAKVLLSESTETILRERLRHAEIKRDDERKGRINAEVKLRRRIVDLAVTQGYSFQPIGILESVFKQKFGTPRQGGLVPSARGCIKIRQVLNPKDLLDSIDQYEYIWITFVFHENTNVTRSVAGNRGKDKNLIRDTNVSNSNSNSSNSSSSSNSNQLNMSFRSKIKPPRLNGKKVGVLSTRSPHRPNPIGISIAKVDRIDSKTGALYISGLDLIDGTPILDIKPYIPLYDSIPSAKFAHWVQDAPRKPLKGIEWSPEAETSVIRILKTHKEKLRSFYDQPSDLQRAIGEVLAFDLRSQLSYSTDKDAKSKSELKKYGLLFDCLDIFFIIRQDFIVEVQEVKPGDHLLGEDSKTTTTTTGEQEEKKRTKHADRVSRAKDARPKQNSILDSNDENDAFGELFQ